MLEVAQPKPCDKVGVGFHGFNTRWRAPADKREEDQKIFGEINFLYLLIFK